MRRTRTALTAVTLIFALVAGAWAIGTSGRQRFTAKESTGTQYAYSAPLLTNGILFSMTANSLNNGDFIKLITTTSGFGNGSYLNCLNGSTEVFNIGVDGTTAITSATATTNSLTVTNNAATTGDLLTLVADSDNLTTGGYMLRCLAGSSSNTEVFSIADDGNTIIAGTLAVTGASTLTGAVTCTAGVQAAAVARTATTDGLGDGTIAAGTSWVTVSSDSVNKIIKLPAPVVGNIIRLMNGSTGYEIRTSAPETIAINGGTGIAAESAIGANVLVTMYCTGANTWVGTTLSTNGTAGAVEVAAP